MATTTIPWGDGSGDNIYLTYSASQGDQTVLVSSDANGGAARTKDITFSVNVGGTVISRVLTVLQPAQSELIVPIYNGVYPSYNDVARGFAVSIPSEYQRVEYISAIGTSVIDTGIVAEETDVIYATYMLNPDYLSVNTDKMLFCCKDGYSGGGVWVDVYGSQNRWYARFGSPGSVNGLFDTYLSGKHTAELKKQSLSIDGNKILAPSFSSMPNTSICFAGKLNTSNVIAWGFCGNLYEGTGILKADGSARWWGIPVKRLSDDAGGMFDIVSNNFYPSLGTSPFGVGPAV